MSVKVVRGMSFIGLLLSFLSITLGGLPAASASLIGPLTVQITSPASDSQMPAGTVAISGTSAAIFILAVEVTIDGSFPGYRLARPAAPGDWSTWSIDYELPAGSHYFLARVTALNGQAWHSVGVYGTSDTPRPIDVRITSPASNSQLPNGIVTVNGTAAGTDISAVEVTIDGNFSGYQLAIPVAPDDWSKWSIDYNLPAGPHYFLARVTAASGQEWDSVGVIGTTGMSSPGSVKDCSELPVRDFRGVSFIDESLVRRETGGLPSSTQYVIESMQHIKDNGFTAIRVPYNWESYVYNSTEFINRIQLIAEAAQANEICVFFANFHYFTSSYWHLQGGAKARGNGFPSFVLKDFPATNNDYIQTAGPFWNAFLSNSIIINGRNVWNVQAEFFKDIIDRVDRYDSVAGYEILNEPHLFDPSQYQKLGNYHTYMANEIREVSDKKIFFDRETTWGFTRSPSLEPMVAPRGVTGIVYAPHLYAIPYPDSQAESQIKNFKNWSQQWGSEVLIGEMAPVNQDEADQYLKVLQENGFGWTAWSWKQSQSTGLGRTYYESDTAPATEVLEILVAAMAKVY